jgi:hypothetical protein
MFYCLICREAQLQQEGHIHLEEFQEETFHEMIDNITVIKQAGGYSAVTFPSVLVMKDMWKYGTPNTSLADFM